MRLRTTVKPGAQPIAAAPSDPRFYREVLDHMSDGVYFVDNDRRILYWNEGAARLTGYKAGEVVGSHCQDDILCHVDPAGTQLCRNGCPLSASMEDGRTHEAEVYLRHKQGWRIPVNVRVQPLRGEGGAIVGAIEIFSDNTLHNEERRRQRVMERLAFIDHLTQLPNRRFLEMSLHTAIVESQVHGEFFGLLLIDFDYFKQVNDCFGHSCGDHALQEVAHMLYCSLRPTDVLGRWGGDEFLAIVFNVDATVLAELARRCVMLVARTSILSNDERPIHLSVSVGGVLAQPGETPVELLERADRLMYQSKANGRGRATTE